MTNQPADEKNKLVGKIIADSYEIVAPISRGASGDVYLVVHRDMDTKSAAKLLRVDAVSQTAMKRLQREAQILSRLKHPNIVNVRALAVDASVGIFLVMDYLDGKPLSKIIAERGRLKIGQALKLTIDICHGLECAHQQGVLHRDIKPSNVIVVPSEGSEKAVVIDFGLAKHDEDVQKITSTGLFVGTPLYMSPEQCRGEKLDARSDIYSIGCLLYELLAGRPPFTGTTPLEVMTNHLNKQPPPLSETNPELVSSSPLDAIVQKALAKEPEQRFQSVAELRQALEEYRATPFVASTLRRKRKFNLSLGLFATAASIVCVAGVALWMLAQPPIPQTTYSGYTRLNIHQLQNKRDEALAGRRWQEALSAAEEIQLSNNRSMSESVKLDNLKAIATADVGLGRYSEAEQAMLEWLKAHKRMGVDTRDFALSFVLNVSGFNRAAGKHAADVLERAGFDWRTAPNMTTDPPTRVYVKEYGLK
jgi:serine/threonine protein kinase